MDKHPIAEVLLNFLETLLQWRKFIVRTILVGTIITFVISLFLPKWYKSTTSMLPAEKADIVSNLAGISSLVKSVTGGGGGFGLGQQSETQRYFSILKSERLLTAVIEKFNLTQVYGIKSYPHQSTIKELSSNIVMDVADEGHLTLSVYDKDPVRAAEMANYFIEQLNIISSEMAATNALSYKKFIEQRYNITNDNLQKAEEVLKEFQEKYGIFSMEDQMESSIKISAELYGKLSLKEIEAGILQKTVSADNAALKSKLLEVSELKNKIEELQNGVLQDSSIITLLPSFKKAPSLAIQYFRYIREVKIQTKILEFITPVYEQAKMEEKKNTPTVLVLDKAVPAEYKAKPKRVLLTALGFLISTLLSLFIVFFSEMLQRLKLITSPTFQSLLHNARSDWFGLLRKKE